MIFGLWSYVGVGVLFILVDNNCCSDLNIVWGLVNINIWVLDFYLKYERFLVLRLKDLVVLL